MTHGLWSHHQHRNSRPRRRFGPITIVFTTIGLFAALLAVPNASGQAGAAISLSSNTAAVGDTITVSGSGFSPGVVSIHLDVLAPSAIVSNESVGRTGAFSSSFVVPEWATPGSHRVLACRDLTSSEQCAQQAAASLTVTAPFVVGLQIAPTPTPTTGFVIGAQPTSTPTTPPVIVARPTSTPTPRPTPTAPPVIVARPTSTPTPRPTPTAPPVIVAQPTSTPTPRPTPTAPPVIVAQPTSTPTVTPPSNEAIPPSPTPTSTPLTASDDLAILTPVPTSTSLSASDDVAILTPVPTREVPDFAPNGLIGDNDIYVRAIEVTQGVQDLESQMALVAHRKTWVRVHPRVIGNDLVSFVDGALLLERNGAADVIVQASNPGITIGGDVDRTNPNSALNFELDETWLEGVVNITAAVWSGNPSSIADEPFPDNNMDTITVVFQDVVEPSILLVGLEDGAGPGPQHNLLSLLSAYTIFLNDLLEFHPTSSPDIMIHPIVLTPGFASVDPGPPPVIYERTWDLTNGDGRTAPNIVMNQLEMNLGIGGSDQESQQIMGLFHLGIPSGGFSGWANNNVSWSMPKAGTPAHEYAHNEGLGHVGCKDSDGDGVPDELAGGALDPTHPNAFPNCSLAPIDETGFFGFTTYREPFTIFSNDPAHPQAAFPLMSYMGPKWNDAFHWCRLIFINEASCSTAGIGIPGLPQPQPGNVDCDPSPGDGAQLDLCLSIDIPWAGDPFGDQLPPDEPVLLFAPDTGESVQIIAQIGDDPQGDGALQFTTSRTATTPLIRASFDAHVADVLAGEISPDVQIKIVAADGTLLATVPAGRSHAGHGDGASTPTSSVAVSMPWPADGYRVELVVSGEVIAANELSATAPAVTNVQTQFDGDAMTVSWDGSDADGDDVGYDVNWSTDGGSTWTPLAMNIIDQEVSIATTALLPGGTVTVIVEANDGLRSGRALSESIAVTQRDPLVAVALPADGRTIDQYRLVELFAIAQDPEDGQLDDSTISWHSTIDGDLGTGRRLGRSDLSVGEHTITVSGTDGDGAESSHSITLTIKASERPKIIEPSDELLAAFGRMPAGQDPMSDPTDLSTTEAEPASAGGASQPVGTTEPGRNWTLPIAVAAAVAGGVATAGASVVVRRRKTSRSGPSQF